MSDVLFPGERPAIRLDLGSQDPGKHSGPAGTALATNLA